MTTTGRVDHTARALELITPVSVLKTIDSVNEKRIAAAQVHATLALVEQQRIANLIALSTPQNLLSGAEASLPSWDEQYQLRADIREGLGL